MKMGRGRHERGTGHTAGRVSRPVQGGVWGGRVPRGLKSGRAGRTGVIRASRARGSLTWLHVQTFSRWWWCGGQWAVMVGSGRSSAWGWLARRSGLRCAGTACPVAPANRPPSSHLRVDAPVQRRNALTALAHTYPPLAHTSQMELQVLPRAVNDLSCTTIDTTVTTTTSLGFRF